jgi:hypothetical protein
MEDWMHFFITEMLSYIPEYLPMGQEITTCKLCKEYKVMQIENSGFFVCT